jgi:bla regulator protein blaR1
MMALLFDHLWQSTLFTGVIAILTLALRRNRPRLRYGLWLAASIKFLVPFAVLAAAGALLEWRQAPASIRSVVASSGVRDFNAPFASMSFDPTAMVTASVQPRWIAAMATIVWVCGFTAIALRRMRQWREIRAAVRTSTPFAPATPAPASIEIRTALTALEPGVVGFRHPVILLPRGIDSYLTADQLAAVLAHEICHVRRRDNLTAAMHMLVEAVYWFHPVVWWIGARLVAEREQACDEYVVAETAKPIAYAEGIVSVCRRYVEAPLMSVSGVGGADIKARIDAILCNRIGVRLTLSKRILLITAAVVSLVIPTITGAIEAAAFAAGQLPGATAGGPAIDPQLRFEVASIKPVADSGRFGRFIPTSQGFEYTELPIGWLLRLALQKPDYQVIGAPRWVDTEFFTIRAKAPDRTPPGALTTMMLNLLKDRFQLATHLETRELPIFNLVVARTDGRLGRDIKATPADCQATVAARDAALQAAAAGRGAPPPLPPIGDLKAAPPCGFARFLTGDVAVSGRTIAQFVTTLSEWVGRPVIDKTGMSGLYDFTLKFAPEGVRAAGPLGPTLAQRGAQVPAPVDPDAPGLSAALQEQLGLKLEAARGPVEVVVIDRLEKPTPD